MDTLTNEELVAIIDNGACDFRDSVEEEDAQAGLFEPIDDSIVGILDAYGKSINANPSIYKRQPIPQDARLSVFDDFDVDFNQMALKVVDYRNVCNYCNIRLCVQGDICGYGPKDEPTPVGANPDTCRHRVLGVQHGDDDWWFSCESCWLIIEEEFLRGRTYTYDVDNHTWVQKGRSPRKKKG